MLTPSSVKVIEPALAAYKVRDNDDLAQHLQSCSQQQLSVRLDIRIQDYPIPQWSLFFHLGRLVWAASEIHPVRRWNRQLLQYCPHLVTSSIHKRLNQYHHKYWDYDCLMDALKQEVIQQQDFAVISTGNNAEILFDIMQMGDMQLQNRLAMQVDYRHFSEDSWDLALTQLTTEESWQQAKSAWTIWKQVGLEEISPNFAPIICDSDALRQQTSLLDYHNLVTLANGRWTLRDLAVKLKQSVLPLSRTIMSYVHQNIMGLTQTVDTHYFVRPSGALIAYIEDSQFDSARMGHILAQANHQFLGIRDSTQALPMLLEHKPDLIFLDLMMPIANGYEICSQIRRISIFKDIPVIIVTSNDGIVDRVRAKLVGSTGFISKPIEKGKIMAIVRQYLSA
jgi:CheY-like chemotaxis protein